MVLITFIIPIRHYENIRDISVFNKYFNQTILSIKNQTNPSWKAIIVANEGMKLQVLPENFYIKYVDFEKNINHECKQDLEIFRESVRLDKGKRILAGMLESKETQYYMIVDDDDVISSALVEYVDKNRHENGWKISKGFIWNSDSNLLYKHNNFNKICGTSHIIKNELYNVRASIEKDEKYIKDMFGSHVKIDAILEDAGKSLLEFPFRAVLYRVGHVCSHSQNGGIFNYFIKLNSIKSIAKNIGKIVKLRFFSKKLKKEFSIF